MKLPGSSSSENGWKMKVQKNSEDSCTVVRVFDVFRRVRKGSSAGSTSRDTVHEDECHRLNAVKPKPLSSSIFELYSPSATDTIALDIFFFHGLQQENTLDAHVSTWRSKPGDDPSEVIWPQAWLPAKYPQARIMTVSYDASIKTTGTEGRMDLHLIGEALLEEIWQVRQANSHPLILVGHSFGGLVIKQLCTHAFERKASNTGCDVSFFLDYMEGILFYGTPHRGMEFPEKLGMLGRLGWNSLMWYWNSIIQSVSANDPLLNFVEKLSTDAARLHEKFEKTLSYYGWQIYAVNETHAGSEGKVLVPEASSRSGGTNIFVGSDHYSICRPVSQQCIKYLHLCKLIDPFYGKIKSREKGFHDFSSRLVLEGNSMGDLLERAKRHLQEHAFLGFAGMAGSGKTAVATLVAKSLERDCLSESGVLGGEFTPVPPNRAEFEKEVKAKLSGRYQKLFLILDDIPDLSHTYADKLQEIAVANGERVKFIATSRDKGVLRKLGWIMERDHGRQTWNIPLLEFGAAEKLFYSHAFPVELKAPSHLKKLVDEVVQGCAGLPLCLEVAGRYLQGEKDRQIWEEISQALREVADEEPLEGVWRKLRASYDCLGVEEKEMFLDVACFLLSEDSREIPPKGCPFSFDEIWITWMSMYKRVAVKWKTLLDRFLVQKEEVVDSEVCILRENSILAGVPDSRERHSTGGETSEIQVHEHLKAIGAKIAGNLSRYLRIPPGGDPAANETNHLGKIVALSAKDPSFEAPVEEVNDNPCCGWKDQTRFVTLESVRYLTLKVPRVCRKCNAKGGMRLPRGLRMLQWSGSTSDIIKLDQQPSFWQSLVVLKLKRDDDCCLDILSPDMCRNLLNLQRLSVESKDTSLRGLVELRQLRYLEIQCELLGLLPDLGSLSELKFLCLKKCSRLKTWPTGMDFRSLSNLQTLMLESCLKLQTLPSQFHPILKRLSVTHCHNIRFLPAGIGELPNLKTLNLDSCTSLENLPESFGRLSSLMSLSLAHCKNLRSLPDSFGGLSNLATLSLNDCKGLVTLPWSFWKLSSLRILRLDNCTELRTVGNVLWALPSLEFLNLDFCDNLPPDSIPSLPGLKISRLGFDRELSLAIM